MCGQERFFRRFPTMVGVCETMLNFAKPGGDTRRTSFHSQNRQWLPARKVLLFHAGRGTLAVGFPFSATYDLENVMPIHLTHFLKRLFRLIIQSLVLFREGTCENSCRKHDLLPTLFHVT